MARLGDVVRVEASSKQVMGDKFWLLNLDMVEQQTGNVIAYNYVGKDALTGSIIQFDTNCVLYSKLRPNLNKVVLPNQDGFATSEMLPLRPDTKVLTKEYLAVFLRSDGFVLWAVSKTSGAKMPRLGTKELLSKEIPLPSLLEQERIAQRFAKIDELISLRKEQLAKLEQLVKARFVEMFGAIPDSKHTTMTNVCSIITDGTHQPPKFVSSGIPFLFVSNIVTNKITYKTEKYISEETYAELIKRTPIAIGDILLSTVGSYGHPAVVETDEHFCFQRHIAYLKPKKNIVNSRYLYGVLLASDVQKQIEEKVKGIAQKTLNLSEIRKLHFPLPSMEQQSEFAAFVEQADKSKLTIQQSLDKLEVMKKALMQEYFG